MAGLPPLGFFALFAGMWSAVSYLISRLSGWRALAARYPAAAEPAGERLIWTSAQLGGVSFRSCLNVTVSASGLYLVPSLAFRLFMPPLLVPWRDVRFEGFWKVFFLSFACLRLGSGGPVLAVRRRTAARFVPFLSEGDRREHAAERAFAGRLVDRRLRILALAAGAAGLVAALLAGRR